MGMGMVKSTERKVGIRITRCGGYYAVLCFTIRQVDEDYSTSNVIRFPRG